MILEGIVTTVDSTGTVNIAPMGPHLPNADTRQPLTSFELRPFRTSRTHANLKSHPEGVLHVSDDVLLLARSAIGTVDPLPEMRPAESIRGWVLANACRAYEFRLVGGDESSERVRFQAEVVRSHWQRDFFGFNRARHAVLEAAILATRTAILAIEEIEAEFSRLAVVVRKTGGEEEQEAFALLKEHVEAARRSSE